MRLGLKGETPAVTAGSLKSSTLHNTTSINGTPASKKGLNPSRLDKDGKTPKGYLDSPII